MACLSQAVLVTWWVAQDGGRYCREEGSGKGSLRTKETRVDRGMVVGGNIEEGWFESFSSKSTYM